MFENIFELKYIVIYLVMINVIGFLAMYLDKQKARNGSWRISEKTLMMLTALGGGIGTLTGMYLFRHKTKKLKFTIGIPVIIIAEILLVIISIMT